MCRGTDRWPLSPTQPCWRQRASRVRTPFSVFFKFIISTPLHRPQPQLHFLSTSLSPILPSNSNLRFGPCLNTTHARGQANKPPWSLNIGKQYTCLHGCSHAETSERRRLRARILPLTHHALPCTLTADTKYQVNKNIKTKPTAAQTPEHRHRHRHKHKHKHRMTPSHFNHSQLKLAPAL